MLRTVYTPESDVDFLLAIKRINKWIYYFVHKDRVSPGLLAIWKPGGVLLDTSAHDEWLRRPH